ncbi:Spx/MgsR family RNA polymerase-binding regulatory protein [Bacillus lacus]|uniref:Spx/MgsR family RNA polymerase-binding regulatory protein n=1 Tax=Metabacillus lacus TaxID=1983721 RepID=A0A7X2LYN3_9BACI|nr:arsenate reductase family protein [Metabacillus lacus]MRX72023.1 Spx/MgsR family RNA polymerase-binding regulatory protein [Metabacillus lacus]
MALTFYLYPKCGTCRNAKKWFENHGIETKEVHIAENPPSVEELKEMYQNSGLQLKKFFNTSGQKYRQLGLKDKLPDMTEDEQLNLLATDGMLIKRPIVTDGEKVTVGFKEEDYNQAWNS